LVSSDLSTTFCSNGRRTQDMFLTYFEWVLHDYNRTLLFTSFFFNLQHWLTLSIETSLKLHLQQGDQLENDPYSIYDISQWDPHILLVINSRQFA
jgi:hypothetical protein